MKAFKGRILVCDLDREKNLDLPIDEKAATQFLGGSGYAAYLLNKLLDPDTPALDPGNVLAIMTGPLTGTMAPCTGRHVVCSRSPMTGLWGESHSGGHFGANLKFAGYDGILVRGRSPRPVMLLIDDGEVEVESARHLWGKTTSETQDTIAEELGKAHIACIGPAGENLVKYASIVNAERVAARCGLGAVMGSKNLKAVVVKGTGQVELAEPEEFRRLATQSSKTLGETMSTLRNQGTAMYVDIGMMFNDMSIRYFQNVEFDASDLINAEAMNELLTGRTACHSCPISCGRRISVPELGLVNVAGPEYQTLASFGSNLLISDLNKIALMNRLCNEYGMDTISCGSTIALAIYLCDTGRAEYGLSWGDPDTVIELIHKIAQRENDGRILAEGARALAQRHHTEDSALHVRGLEVPNHDPRAFGGMAAVYTTASRGATHLEGDMYSVDMGLDYPELGIIGGDRLQNESKGMIAARSQQFRAFCDSVIICHFALVPLDSIVSLLSLGMGASFSVADILPLGARAVTMKRILNLKLGLRTEDERLPRLLLEPQADGATYDFVPDVDAQLDEYYSYRRWDRETGAPTPEALSELGLESFIS
ncbi:aldehyde ferredoxin oxidoreductase [Candidatus Thorarchaeota archaeon]|nr:MAG: aldehyde ferredoxin oxidoreductase [Candidatus Thorarchaeota archaeon]